MANNNEVYRDERKRRFREPDLNRLQPAEPLILPKNPYVIERKEEPLPIRACPDCPDGDPTGYRVMKRIERPAYKSNISEK